MAEPDLTLFDLLPIGDINDCVVCGGAVRGRPLRAGVLPTSKAQLKLFRHDMPEGEVDKKCNRKVKANQGKHQAC